MDRRRLAVVLAPWLPWGAAVAFALRHLRPDSPWLENYTSDSAILLLMARAPQVDLFHAYYLGQDRVGAWFPLALRLLTRNWSAEAMWAVQHGVVLTCGPAMALLAQGGALRRAAVSTAAILALLLSPDVRTWAMMVGHPYGPQLTAWLWSWVALRSGVDALGGRPRRGAMALATLGAALALWSSPASAPLLGGVALAEGWRARVRRPGVWATLLLPCALGLVFERQLRRLYHRFSERSFGHAFRSDVKLDSGHLLDNAHTVLDRMAAGWGPALLALGAVSLLAAWLARRGAPRRPLREEPLAFLSLTCLALSALQLPVLAAVRHLRLNEFATRYFTPTSFTLALFAGLALAWALQPLGRWWEARARANPARGGPALAAAAALLLLLPAALPPRPPSTSEYADALAAARALAARAPGALLLGGYWEVYQLAALQPPRSAARPLVVEGDHARTPFLVPALQGGEAPWYVGTDPEGAAEAAAFRVEYGVVLECEGPATGMPGGRFAVRCRNRAPEAQVPTTRPEASDWRPCAPGAPPLEVPAPSSAATGPWVAYLRLGGEHGAALEEHLLEMQAHSLPDRVPLRCEREGAVLRVTAPGGSAGLTLRVTARPGTTCALQAVRTLAGGTGENSAQPAAPPRGLTPPSG